jgi:hypothetical protein
MHHPIFAIILDGIPNLPVRYAAMRQAKCHDTNPDCIKQPDAMQASLERGGNGHLNDGIQGAGGFLEDSACNDRSCLGQAIPSPFLDARLWGFILEWLV